MSNLLKVKAALENAVNKLNGDYPPYQVLPAVRDALDLVNAELEENPPTIDEVEAFEEETKVPDPPEAESDPEADSNADEPAVDGPEPETEAEAEEDDGKKKSKGSKPDAE